MIVRYFIIVSFVFFIDVSSFCQSKKDSLLVILEKQQPDSSRIKILYDLAMELGRSNPDSAIIFGNIGLEMARNRENKLMQAKIADELASAYSVKDEHLEAISLRKKALLFIEKTNVNHMNILAKIYNNIATNYRRTNNSDSAMANWEEAIKIYEELGDSYNKSKVLASVGSLYGDLGLLNEALETQMQALKELGKDVYPNLLCRLYYNIGTIYLRMENYSESLFNFKRALVAVKKSSNEHMMTYICLNMGENFSRIGEYDSAEFYIKKSQQSAQKLQNKTLIHMANFILCGINFKMGDMESGKAALDETIVYYEHKKHVDFIPAYALKALILTAEGSYVEADEMMTRFIRLYSESQSDEFQKKLANMEVKYKVGEKEKEIELLEKKNRVKSLERNRATLISLLVIIGSVALFIYFINRRRILKKELDYKNRQLVSQVMQLNNNKTVFSEAYDLIKASEPDIRNNANVVKLSRLVNENVGANDIWEKFRLHFEGVYPDFFNKLRNVQPNLTTNDLKLCAYVKMRLSQKEIATLLNITHKSCHVAIYRLKKKLNLNKDKDLLKFILRL